jgi:hypothetical protein
VGGGHENTPKFLSYAISVLLLCYGKIEKFRKLESWKPPANFSKQQRFVVSKFDVWKASTKGDKKHAASNQKQK